MTPARVSFKTLKQKTKWLFYLLTNTAVEAAVTLVPLGTFDTDLFIQLRRCGNM